MDRSSYYTASHGKLPGTGPAERIYEWEGGGLMQKRKREETKGYGCLFPRENFKFRSSEMAISASKTANSNINL